MRVIYEIREYTAVPGRMPALVARFREHTLGLFAKHGMELTFISLSEVGPNSNNELVYVMRFDSYQEMATKWAGFMADPEWVEVKKASEVDGPLVVSIARRVLDPTPFG